MENEKKVSRVALYCRCSTSQQDIRAQLEALEIVCGNHGWVIVNRYTDEGISGATGADQRPQLDALLKAAGRKEFDRVVVWAVDRLGRSLKHLVAILSLLQDKGIDLYAHNQGIDTSTSTGRLMWQLVSVFAEFEREMIRDRVRMGLDRAKRQGKQLGRPAAYKGQEAEILRLRAEGLGVLKIAKRLGVGTGSVQRVIASGDKPSD